MGSLKTGRDYVNYKTLLYHVNGLIRFYEKNKDNVHNHFLDIQNAKRMLLKTKFRALNGPNNTKISISNASDQQINMAFKNSFSKADLSMVKYLKTITKPWYEVRMKNYEEKLRKLDTKASLSDLIVAEQIAKKENHPERSQYLRENIEQRLDKCTSKELKKIWDKFIPNITHLIKYKAFRIRI